MDRVRPHFTIEERISIDRIYSFHYSELTKDYVHRGEQHDFWEFLYVDKGVVEVTTGPTTFHLRQGDMVFYSPNEFHSLRCNRRTPPDIFIISFGCRSEAMSFFEQRSLRLGDEERWFLTQLIEEGNKTFAVPVAPPRLLPPGRRAANPLARKENPEFGSEQLIKILLEALLIRLVRKHSGSSSSPRLSPATKERREPDLAERIVEYLEAHLRESPSVDQLCSVFPMSRTRLRALFRAHTGCGVTEYMVRLRIERAKRYLREETSNITEISERLGYSSIHYFSRQFRKTTGISPTEYLKTMKAHF